MADVAVENNETPVVEKVAEVDVAAVKKDAVADDATDNGTEAVETKENGAAAADESKKADATADDGIEEAADETATPEENDDKAADEADANGADDDASPAEAVKRKAGEDTKKTEESVGVPTPEKKAKLDETAATKDEVQNGSEASEVAA